jgi:hypothetical protein
MTTDNFQIPDGEDRSQEVGMETQVNGRGGLNKIRALLQQNALDRLSCDKREDYQEYFIEDYSAFSEYSLSKINEWEAANGTPNKLYFSLFEAAWITNIDQVALLHAGGRGAIVLCTPLPPGVSVAPFREGTIGKPIEQPELLVLSNADCRSIELNGFAAQSDFNRGYAFTYSEATCIFPGYRNVDFMYEDATWKILADNNASYINVLTNWLFITRASLCKLLDGQIAGIKEDSPAPEVQPVTQTKPWLIKDDADPAPEQDWYIPARYFARQCVKNDAELANDRRKLAVEVVKLLVENKIYKRGGKKAHDPATVLKAFIGVNLLKFLNLSE